MNKCQYYAGYTWELIMHLTRRVFDSKHASHLSWKSNCSSDFQGVRQILWQLIMTVTLRIHNASPKLLPSGQWLVSIPQLVLGWRGGSQDFQSSNDVHSNITYFHTIPAYLMLRSTTLNYIEVSQTTACQTHLVKLERIVLSTRFDFFFVRTKCKGGWSEIPTDPIHAEVWSIFFLVIKTK